MNNKNCKTCSKLFSGYGENCGTCRSKLSRNRNEKPVAEDSVAPVALEPVATEGHCHGCSAKQENPNVCICYRCIEKGITHKSLGLDMCKAQETKIKFPGWKYGEPNMKHA